jgi:hypothetical protein
MPKILSALLIAAYGYPFGIFKLVVGAFHISWKWSVCQGYRFVLFLWVYDCIRNYSDSVDLFVILLSYSDELSPVIVNIMINRHHEAVIVIQNKHLTQLHKNINFIISLQNLVYSTCIFSLLTIMFVLCANK